MVKMHSNFFFLCGWGFGVFLKTRAGTGKHDDISSGAYLEM